MNKPPDSIERDTVAVQARIADALERIAAALEKLTADRTGTAEVETASEDDQIIEVNEIATPEDIIDENQITTESYDVESDDDIPDENKITSDDYKIIEDDSPPDEGQISSQDNAAADNQNEAKEKRKHPRKPCSIVVDYASRDRAFRDYIRDISSGGVFIETSKEFLIGDEIMMTFSISNKQKPFKFTGQVVRITNKGIGVKFKKKFTK